MCDEWLSCCASVPVFSVDFSTKGAVPVLVGVPADCTLVVTVGNADADGAAPNPAKAALPISATFPSGPRRFGESSSRFFSNFGTLGILALSICQIRNGNKGKQSYTASHSIAQAWSYCVLAKDDVSSSAFYNLRGMSSH